MRTPIYLIVYKTGQVNEEGVESVILVDVKLSHLAAEQIQRANPGSEIKKMIADKEVD